MPTLGLPNLQGIYDATVSETVSGEPHGVIRLNGKGIALIDDTPDLDSRFRIEDEAGNRVIDFRNGAIDFQGFNIADADQPVMRMTDGSAGMDSFQVWPDNPIFTANPFSMFRHSGTAIHDYANTRMAALNLQGVMEIRQSAFGFNFFLLLNNGNTFRNAAGVAANFGPGQSFIDQPTVQVNGAVTISMSRHRSFLSQPRFNRTVVGQGTLNVTQVAQVELFGEHATGVNITDWHKIRVGAFTAATGTLGTLNGILFDDLTGATTIRCIRSTQIAGTFIDHQGTAPSNFGGAINLGNGATLDVQLLRGAANRLDLASGDSLRLLGGALQLASATEAVQSGGAGITQILAATRAEFDAPATLASLTVAGVPSASPAGMLIYVSDETGGAVPAFSDGSNWRRVTDRAIIA